MFWVLGYGKGKEEKKSKWKIDKEYPKWPWVEYKGQVVKFF
jgi:hypothetical protein